MTKTFYLQYRPQKLADLDLKEVREQLIELLASVKIPHAFLFSGPKGTGKTSSARIVAKAVNCLNRAKGKAEPCNRCEVCQSIISGQAMDLIEIDAASNRGIDDIRDLKEKIKLAPAMFKRKVYIIDEVHMLTTEAFNALLKTLEEPPAHALFILCTTEPHKLPATIVSRCLNFKFRRANKEEIVRSLQRVVKAEKLKLKPVVLELIAQSSDGSFRDAVKILEQLSFKSKTITQKQVKTLLGQGGETEFFQLLAERETKAALTWLNGQLEQGVDLKRLGESWLDLWRRCLLASKGIDQELPAGLPDFSEVDLRILLELFSRALLTSKTAAIPQLPYELAIIEWGENKNFNVSACGRSPGGRQNSNVQDKESVESSPQKAAAAGKEIKLEVVQHQWPAVLRLLKPQNHSLEALLKAARPVDFADKKLTVEVFYPFHKSRLETERCRVLVEEALEKTLAQKVKICYVLSEQPKPALKKKDQPEELDPAEMLSQAAVEIFNN